MQSVSPEFEAAVASGVLPVDRAERAAALLEDLAAKVRRHGVIEGSLAVERRAEKFDHEVGASGYLGSSPTGVQTWSLNLSIDGNQVR